MSQASSKKRSPKGADKTPQQSNEDEKASYKRRRIALACTSCRNRKSRCNGAKPACSLCVQMGFDCVYEQPTNPQISHNARQEDGYEGRLKSIENTLQLLLEQKEQQPETRRESKEHPRRTPLRNNGSTEAQDFAVVEGDEACLEDASEDRVDGLATIGDSDKDDLRYFGPSSNISLLNDISKMISRALHSRSYPQRDLNSAAEPRLVSRMQSPDQSISGFTPTTTVSHSPYYLPAIPQAITLIEHFFADTGMLFPYISKQYITTSYQSARQKKFDGVKRSWLCLLNMIFAFATFTNMSHDQSLEENMVDSKIFFNRAQDLFNESRYRLADLDLVQGLLLMSQYRQGTQRSDETWSLHALAVHAAIQIGLHCPANAPETSPREIEMRKRTWFGCVMLDSTLSMTLGRPPSVARDHTVLELPLNEELDSIHNGAFRIANGSGSARGKTACLFIATIQLYKIQSKIISTLYHDNLYSGVATSLERLIVKIAEIEHDLRSWELNLFPELKLKPWTSATPSATSVFDPVFERLSVIIRLRFLNARLLTHRITLQTLSSYATNSQGDHAVEVDSFSSKLGVQSVMCCASSACELVDIVNRMSTEPMKLGGRWFSIYYTFHAILVTVACLIYYLETHSGQNSDICPDWTNLDLQRLASSLPKGREAIERLGKETRSSKRISRTLTRMIKICATIAQSNTEASSVILPALGYTNFESGHSSTHNIGTFDSLRDTADGNSYTNDISQNADFFIGELPDFWTQSELDIFATLGGYDVGLSNIMTS